MKKLVTLFMAICFVLVLSACNSTNKMGEKNMTDQMDTKTMTEKPMEEKSMTEKPMTDQKMENTK